MKYVWLLSATVLLGILLWFLVYFSVLGGQLGYIFGGAYFFSIIIFAVFIFREILNS